MGWAQPMAKCELVVRRHVGEDRWSGGRTAGADVEEVHQLAAGVHQGQGDDAVFDGGAAVIIAGEGGIAVTAGGNAAGITTW